MSKRRNTSLNSLTKIDYAPLTYPSPYPHVLCLAIFTCPGLNNPVLASIDGLGGSSQIALIGLVRSVRLTASELLLLLPLGLPPPLFRLSLLGLPLCDLRPSAAATGESSGLEACCGGLGGADESSTVPSRGSGIRLVADSSRLCPPAASGGEPARGVIFGSYRNASSGKTRLLPLLLERCEGLRFAKGALPWDRRRQRKMPIRNTRTAPATSPVAMPTTDAFFNVPEPCEVLAAVGAGVELLDVVGWLATVIIVEGVGVETLVGNEEIGVTDEGSVAEVEKDVGPAGCEVKLIGTKGVFDDDADGVASAVDIEERTDSTLCATSLGAASSNIDSAFVVVARLASVMVADSSIVRALGGGRCAARLKFSLVVMADLDTDVSVAIESIRLPCEVV